MDFNNPQHRKERLEQIRKRCAELPPPTQTKLPDKCWIPQSKLDDDLMAINDYCSGKLLDACKGLHDVTWCLANANYHSHSVDGLEVMHLCNVKSCCNPNHLKLGTRKENNDDAIADGLFDPQGLKGIPRPWQLGEKNVRAKATESQIAEIKWLFKNREQWWTPALRSRYKKIDTVLAIVYGLTEASIKQTRRGKSWPEVEPIKPTELPTAEKIPMDAKPPRPKKGGPIGPENAALILRGYWKAEDKPDYITMWKDQLAVSRISVQKTLSGATWKEVEPDIKRESNFDSHRLRNLSDHDVQAIRATYVAHKEHPRLKSALAERFLCDVSYVTAIVEGVVRMNVLPDPSAALPLEELDLKPKAQHGHHHKLAELEREQVWAILLRLARGDKVLDRVIILCQEFNVSHPVIYGIRSRKRYKEICKQFDEEQRRKREQDGENGGVK